ncbi:MAG: CCA tRNA nucleotidyltransferase [Pirellulales bacterium]|nr:CCA tRNA nucleotidyltransferase [Pirellulales bacterium]
MQKENPNPQRRFAVEVVRRLRDAGFTAYWAGGCVRDQLLGRTPKDYDVATDATPEQIQQLFGRRRTLAIGASFGVITVKGPKVAGMIEVATFRKDAAYSDGRHPDGVTFSSAEEDARRRDFTVNGLFFDPLEERVIDYVGGQADLTAKALRAIGDPRERFAEDKLRMLRAVRFAAVLGFAIEESTLRAIREMAGEIAVVSAERIAMEMRRMLVEPGRVRAVELLLESNLATQVLPEIVPTTEEDRKKLNEPLAVLDRLGAMPTLAVGMMETRENSLYTHDERGHGAPRTNPNFPLALMILLHRIVAADEALDICRRWKLSNDESDRIHWLLEHQASLENPQMLRWSQLQPLLISEYIDDLLTFMEAVSPAAAQAAAYCREELKRPREELDPPPLVTGEDLLALGIPQGPRYRILLEEIRQSQLDENLLDRNEALRWLKMREFG